MTFVIDILEIIGGLVGILAIVIVIWDHFKDDRRLTHEVQEYYENIEHFIEFYLKRGQTKAEHSKKELYLEKYNEFEYYKSVVKTRFEEFSKYLGLTRGKALDKRFEQLDAYITKTGFILVEDGNLLIRDPMIYEESRRYESYAFGSQSNLRKHEAEYINQFFTDLRNHWKGVYSKAFFRPKLQKKFEFYELITK